MFRKSGLKDPVIKPSNQRPSMSTTNSFGNLQTVEEAQIGDFAATRSEIPIDPFNDPQNPAQVVQTIGDFDSVSKFDLRTTCLIRYEVGGELVERRLRPYEVLEMPAER
jgi:hypothetical protein